MILEKITIIIFALLSIGFNNAVSDENIKYQMPSEELAVIVDARPTPGVLFSPDHKHFLILERPALPSIEDLSIPELSIAGIRIHISNLSQSRFRYYDKLKIMDLGNEEEIAYTGLPDLGKIRHVKWSPDSKKIALTLTSVKGIELYVINLAENKARKMMVPRLNEVLGDPYEWLSDSETLLFKAELKNNIKLSYKGNVPEGPVVRESDGTAAPAATYTNLLQDEYDAEKFNFYANVQLMTVNLAGDKQKIGEPGMVRNFNASPDGQYILVEKIKRPFSYLVPYYRFPYTAEILDRSGKIIKQLADNPLAENIPVGFDAVRTGPRSFHWRADHPASIYWVEAADQGNPDEYYDVRDRIFKLDAPFTAGPDTVLELRTRFSQFIWGKGDFALVQERWWKNRTYIISAFAPDNPETAMRQIFLRNWDDAYIDPGNFVTADNQYGRNILLFNENSTYLYLTGRGASIEGNKPFFDALRIEDLQTIRLWQSKAPYYEYPVLVYDLKKQVLITRRESKEETPNYFLRYIKDNKIKEITEFENPYPDFADVTVKIVKYKRMDGLDMTGKLYLPPGYDEGDERLPVLMWAYPQEYKSAHTAGQIKDSPYRFPHIYPGSPVMWALKGYAVFDNPSMAIVGEENKEPNDDFIRQIAWNAKAAVEALVNLGVADSNRIAIGGHSYGAFMTANLLAHTDYFVAGIARSGAYNRTLTPFGFQSEERTFWEAPVTYIQISPFMYADVIKEPLLLIHGEEDNNTGTYPMQSIRFYNALKGHGAISRLVLLPNESHGYRSRESLMHVVWEQDRWLEKYVKNAKSK